MIFKIQPNLLQFKQFTLNADEVETTLGEDCLIFMDSRPTHYLPNWRPLQVEFFDEYPGGDKNKQIPDIMPDLLGKLFLNEKAWRVLAPLLQSSSPQNEPGQNMGECLPVEFEGQKGYLFNPLCIAEDRQALDASRTTYNKWDALDSVAFDASKLQGVTLFRSRADDYRGIYCMEAIKQAVEKAGLTGVRFSDDLRDRPPE